MLIISRKENDAIVIDTGKEQIEVAVVELGRQVRLGISAPESCRIWRKELYATVQENRQATVEAPAQNLPQNLLALAQQLTKEKKDPSE